MVETIFETFYEFANEYKIQISWLANGRTVPNWINELITY